MKTKDAGLRIRVDRELREQFLVACREHDTTAAQVIREFMRNYIDRRSPGIEEQAPAAHRVRHYNSTKKWQSR